MVGFKAVAVLSALQACVVNAEEKCKNAWSYNNVDAWHTIGMCGHKDDQSPINIAVADASAGGEPLKFTAGGPVDAKATLNQHTWEVDYVDSKTTTEFDGKEFKMMQYHFHSPSEHTVDGNSYAFEMHVVHAHKPSGQILVVGFFGEIGKENAYFDSVFSSFPKQDESLPIEKVGNPLHTLIPEPADAAYYHYTGSLTTPPCTNDTIWYVMKKPVTISEAQLKLYRRNINDQSCSQLSTLTEPKGIYKDWNFSLGTNNRPTQNVGGRTVTYFAGTATTEALAVKQDPEQDEFNTAALVVGILVVMALGSWFVVGRAKARTVAEEAYMPLA